MVWKTQLTGTSLSLEEIARAHILLATFHLIHIHTNIISVLEFELQVGKKPVPLEKESPYIQYY